MAAPSVPAPAPATLPEVVAPPPRPRGGPVLERGTVVHDEVRSVLWRLHGIAKVVHDVDVGEGELHGRVIVGGPFLADELRLNGSLDVRGPVAVARRLRADGSIEAHAGLRAAGATVAGKLRVDGELELTAPARLRGSVRAALVRAGPLELRGEVQVPGVVRAERCVAELAPGSSIGEIRGTEVGLRGATPNVVRRVLGPVPPVTVGRVEAASVTIADVRVGLVKGREIVLGPRAHVTAVEGTIVRQHPTSRLGPESWTPPPHGLHR
jgi:cytoskeletal protein CcmA (bactofilin family)